MYSWWNSFWYSRRIGSLQAVIVFTDLPRCIEVQRWGTSRFLVEYIDRTVTASALLVDRGTEVRLSLKGTSTAPPSPPRLEGLNDSAECRDRSGGRELLLGGRATWYGGCVLTSEKNVER